jgi:hypothetical protein
MKRIDPIGHALDALRAPPERPDFFAELRRRAEEEQAAGGRRARRQARALALAAAVLLVAVALLLGFGSPFVRAGGGSAAFASSGLVRTVQDTTVVCTTRTVSGAHAFDVQFSPKALLPAFLTVGSDTYAMVGVVSAKMKTLVWPALPSYQQGVGVSRAHCRRTTERIPLARGALPGPAVRYNNQQHCILDGRVLIRARAVWDAGRFTGSLAVRLAGTRRPIAYGWIAPNGTGGLFISNRCYSQS